MAQTVINQTHFLTKCLETYVSEFGTFPESLEVMLAKQENYSKILQLANGETIHYHRPKTNDSNSVSVLVIRGDGFRIDINKDFERRVTHSGANRGVNP